MLYHLNSTDAGQQFHVKVSIATNLYLALTCPIHTYIHTYIVYIVFIVKKNNSQAETAQGLDNLIKVNA